MNVTRMTIDEDKEQSCRSVTMALLDKDGRHWEYVMAESRKQILLIRLEGNSGRGYIFRARGEVRKFPVVVYMAHLWRELKLSRETAEMFVSTVCKVLQLGNELEDELIKEIIEMDYLVNKGAGPLPG